MVLNLKKDMGNNDNVKSWYIKRFPHDVNASVIPQELVFNQIGKSLENGANISEILGTDDVFVCGRVLDECRFRQQKQ